MALRRSSEVVSFDADSAVDAVISVLDGRLHAFVEYDAEEFNALYVDEATLDLYEDAGHMLAHFEDIYAYVEFDFWANDLFVEDLFPEAGDVEYITTKMEELKFLRVYNGPEAVLLTLDPDEPVSPIVEVLGAVIGADD